MRTLCGYSKMFLMEFSVSNPPTMPPGAITTEVSNDSIDVDDVDSGETSPDDENSSNSIHIFDKSEFSLFASHFWGFCSCLLSVSLHADSKYQSNLNEIDKFEHKSSLETLNKGFGWPTDNIGINLGKSRVIFVHSDFLYFEMHEPRRRIIFLNRSAYK